MRRLFSTFAHGAPGAGLLLMRVAAGGALLLHGVAALTAGLTSPLAALHLICTATGMLLMVGLWTPIVGAVAAGAAGLHAWFAPVDAPMYGLLATLSGALALLGPGAWSVDARLFGWRRVEIRDRRGERDGRAGGDPPMRGRGGRG